MKQFYDIFSFEPHPAASETVGSIASEQSSPGLDIKKIVQSCEGYLIVRTAITMAPGVPPVVAFEELFEERIGEAAFNNDMKQYTGFLVRRVVEAMGGQLVEKGVKIKRRSRYTRGAIYSL